MTRDEIRTESFKRIIAVLNEVFPGIPNKVDGDFLSFDGDAVRIEMTSSDAYEGYFDIRSGDGCLGTLWGVKPIVNIAIKEICNIRKQRVMDTIR